jgi:Mg-chelatase subunit ChlD
VQNLNCVSLRCMDLRCMFLRRIDAWGLGFFGLLCATLAFAQPPALELPREVNAFERFEIRLSASGGSGDMLRFADAEGEVLGGSYAYAGNAKNGVVLLTAPIDPGEYAVVYLSNREVVASYPLTVLSVQAQLSAVDQVNMNGSIEVAFEGPLNSGDYLQFVDSSGEPVRGRYTYTGNAKAGKITLQAPNEPGDYRIAYFTGRRDIGSIPVRVVAVKASLQGPARVAAGAQFSVDWQGPDNRGDILRVVDAAGKATGSYTYTGNNPASAVLRASETPGDYRVVYLTGGEVIGELAFTVEAVTASVSAPDAVPGADYFDVVWEGPGNRGDTIQVVDPETAMDVAYAYVDADRGQQVSVAAPAEPGDYLLHYTTRGGRVLAELPLRVTPPPQLPGSLLVEASPRPRLGPEDAVEVILDASGSMLQRLQGERRIDIARRTLQQLVADTIPAGTAFALRVFGHREADSCRTDLEIPLAPLDPASVQGRIAGVRAMNLAKTPIADSLALTQADLRDARGERIIILLTDGEETCEGDPAAVIAGLRDAGNDIRVNIVGFAIDDAELAASFRRWAQLGGGEYFSASDSDSLVRALTSSVNPAFAVLDENGVRIATGVAGGEVLTLAPGNYTVTAAGTGQAVQIAAGQRTRLSLAE